MSDFDILIHNGVVVTVNPDFDILENGFVTIKGSVIMEVRSLNETGELPRARETIDAGGGIIMPGLVNTHTHLPMVLFRGLADDLPLQKWLNEHIFPAEGRWINEETVRAFSLLACAELILSGTTTCCDGYFFEDEVAKAINETGMRGVLGHGIIDFPAPGVPDPKKNVEAAAEYSKRWLGKFPLITPSIFCHSPYTCSARTLEKGKEAADSMGLLFQIHAAETRTEQRQIKGQYGVTPIRYLDRLGILDAKTLLVHTVWVDEEEIDIIASSGAAVSVATESEMKLASGIARVPDFLEKNIPLGLGTDSAASNNDLDLFQEMDFTAKLHKVNGLDPTLVHARAVIELATIGGARAIGLGDRIGSLAPGKEADILVIDTRKPRLTPMYNPASHIVYAVNGSDVRDVFVSGKLIASRGKLIMKDMDEIFKRVESFSFKLG